MLKKLIDGYINELLFNLAVRTRFELVTSCVTGRHSNLLN